MNRKLALLLLSIFIACATATQIPRTTHPATEAKPITETLHGVTVTDPYRWLEDQDAPATRDWIARETAHTDSVIGNLPQKPAIAARLEQMLNIDQVGTPQVHAGRYFFTKRPKGADQYAIYMRESAGGPDLLLIDPLPMDAKHTISVGIEDVTKDGKVIAYSVRHGGADEAETRFYDVDARHDIGTPLPNGRYFGVAVSPDHRSLYYSRHSEAGDRVYRRDLGGDGEEKLFGDGYGPEKLIFTSLSDNGRYLLIQILYGSAPKKTEIYVKDLRRDEGIVTVTSDLEARSYAEIAGNTLVIRTNWNAPNDRVMSVPIANPGRENWKELVPENKNAALQGTSAVAGRVYCRYLENVQPRVVGYDLDGRKHEEIRFDVLGALSDVSGSWDSPVAVYRFTSFAMPWTVYTYDPKTETSSVFFRPDVPVKAGDFTVEQVWYPSKDGTKVPMFLFYKKGLQRNGANPTLLTGYGGFSLSSLPNFSSGIVTWAEHGGVWALANLRGGAEFGEPWHQAGMLANKQNVFDDFAAAARYLIDQHYTSPRHLGVRGTSNGGLLVSAMLTQHPDLVQAVVCGYPLVDMLRYHKFLVGSYWVPEYGSAADAEQFKWIYAYSPYQHVMKGTKYPAVLFITGDGDTRVAPLHARKMAALVQNSTGSDNPVMIRYHVSSGHMGTDPLKMQVNNEAETLAFLEWQLRQ